MYSEGYQDALVKLGLSPDLIRRAAQGAADKAQPFWKRFLMHAPEQHVTEVLKARAPKALETLRRAGGSVVPRSGPLMNRVLPVSKIVSGANPRGSGLLRLPRELSFGNLAP